MAINAVNILPAQTITTAVTGVTTGTAVLPVPGPVDQIVIQATLTYGSGGTTAKAYLQTSIDNGATWVDVASLAFATATATKISVVNTAAVPATQALTASDGALTDNTVNNGVIGDQLRVKYTTTGTYAGGTTLAVWVYLRRRKN